MSKAPELPQALEWLNIESPPSMEDYRGKIVLVLFWTYSNSHSIRMLPVLRQIQQDHEPLVAILGIHCPKYGHERVSSNVVKALNRNFVRFPCANDVDFEAWRQFGVEAWPTVAIVDATGVLRAVYRGDDTASELDDLVNELSEEALRKEIGDMERIPPTRFSESSHFFRFPSAILEARGLLYVSDAANNRIVEMTKEGRVQRTFGSGNPGFWDGMAQNCGFSMPRGLAYAENFLYVADTGNHAVRRLNLFNGEVETVVGNGKPGFSLTSSTRRTLETGIPLPVGLVFQGPDLFISASGIGQIWRLDLANNTLGWFSGTGQFGVIDGEPVQCAYAQPMGLAANQTFLFVADADGSAIREVRTQSGHVKTRTGQNPFVFGRDDGPPGKALLQYPMDIALRPRSEELWIADSFNDALRVLDLTTGNISTPNVDYELSEPSGIAFAGNTLWIANTNAHEIVRYDLTTRKCEALSIESAL
ncbi:MAG: thioredoxin-like domain-containing protein [Pseudomonadota bacterium]